MVFDLPLEMIFMKFLGFIPVLSVLSEPQWGGWVPTLSQSISDCKGRKPQECVRVYCGDIKTPCPAASHITLQLCV